MAIAYSHRFIFHGTIQADTSANFRADTDTALLAAGWTIIRSITDGKVYESSPAPSSGLAMRLIVQDRGTGGFAGPYIIFQPMSVSEASVGIAHTIVYGNGNIPHYQTIAGCSQFWISVPNAVNPPITGDHSSSFACGVPCLPPGTLVAPSPECSAVGVAPGVFTDIWWANGPGNDAFFYRQDFRSGPRCYGCFEYSVNNVITIVNPSSGVDQSPQQGMLGLFFLSSTYNIDGTGASQAQVITYNIGAPLYIDSLMGWLWQIRGQLWDSFQQTNAQTLDQISVFTDTDIYGRPFQLSAQAWSSSYYSSLRLLTANPGGGEFAYIY